MAIYIHESRKLKQARPQNGQDVDLLRKLRMLLPHSVQYSIIFDLCQYISKNVEGKILYSFWE